MAFLTFNRTPGGDVVRYQRIQPLKLAGRDGLIARHVQSLPRGQTEVWTLEATALAKLAGHAGENLTVLFDAAPGDPAAVCLYELARIHGSCRDTSTNLALDFNVVVDRDLADDVADFTAAFDVPTAAPLKNLREILALTGGPGGGDWKWGTSPIQLGATVVGSHHSGPPGANCNCGRAAAQ